MTCIAYRNGILAADSRIVTGSIIVTNSFRKVACYTKPDQPNVLAGFAGDALKIHTFVSWVEAGGNLGFKPEGDVQGVYIVRDTPKDQPEIFLFDEEGIFQVEDFPYAASGNGSEIALGALHAGVSAEKAVKAACMHHTDCGGEIRMVRFP